MSSILRHARTHAHTHTRSLAPFSLSLSLSVSHTHTDPSTTCFDQLTYYGLQASDYGGKYGGSSEIHSFYESQVAVIAANRAAKLSSEKEGGKDAAESAMAHVLQKRGIRKWVSRLNLRFSVESEETFARRREECVARRREAQQCVSLQNFIEHQPNPPPMSTKLAQSIFDKLTIDEGTARDHVKQLVAEVSSIYTYGEKRGIVLHKLLKHARGDHLSTLYKMKVGRSFV